MSQRQSQNYSQYLPEVRALPSAFVTMDLPDSWGPVPSGMTKEECAGLCRRMCQVYEQANRTEDCPIPEDIPPGLMPLIGDWWDMRGNQGLVRALNEDYTRAARELEIWGLRVRHFRGVWWRRMLWAVLLWGTEEQEGR